MTPLPPVTRAHSLLAGWLTTGSLLLGLRTAMRSRLRSISSASSITRSPEQEQQQQQRLLPMLERESRTPLAFRFRTIFRTKQNRCLCLPGGAGWRRPGPPMTLMSTPLGHAVGYSTPLHASRNERKCGSQTGASPSRAQWCLPRSREVGGGDPEGAPDDREEAWAIYTLVLRHAIHLLPGEYSIDIALYTLNIAARRERVVSELRSGVRIGAGCNLQSGNGAPRPSLSTHYRQCSYPLSLFAHKMGSLVARCSTHYWPHCSPLKQTASTGTAMRESVSR